MSNYVFNEIKKSDNDKVTRKEFEKFCEEKNDNV